MKEEINLKSVVVAPLTPQEESEEGKRWSYSFVYFLEDLRNVYRLYDNYNINSIPALYAKCMELGLKSWSGKSWSQRNLLEQANALKNFGLLSVEDNKVKTKGLFDATRPEAPLSLEEHSVFKDIYLNYFRFKEFHKLFVLDKETIKEDELFNNSTPVYYYMEESRFTNRFLLKREPEPLVVGIEPSHADMMRFWDVFLKWGSTLKMLQKYPLKPFGITTRPVVEGLSIAFFRRRMPDDFSVFDYIIQEMQGSYFYIPDVVCSIMKNLRYSVEEILQRIAEESASRPDLFRAQSTSAIFINERERFLFPKIGVTYITHLLKL